MLIFEAIFEIQERIKLKKDYGNNIPEYFEALELAKKALEKQLVLADYLESFASEDEEKHKDDTYSRTLVMEFLNSLWLEYEDELDVDRERVQENLKNDSGRIHESESEHN